MTKKATMSEAIWTWAKVVFMIWVIVAFVALIVRGSMEIWRLILG